VAFAFHGAYPGQSLAGREALMTNGSAFGVPVNSAKEFSAW